MEEKKTSFEKSEIKEIMKPELEIVGGEGNAFYILGMAQVAAKKAGWGKERIEAFMTKAQSGDYNNLLNVCMEHFDVC